MRFLERLGLNRRELRAWAMYDWANSPFQSTIITAIFPIYFSRVAAADMSPLLATQYLASATTVALAVAAIVSPVLGAMADFAAMKKRLLGLFMGLAVAASAAMFLIQRGDWMAALVLFVLGNIGAACSLTFYDSLLPHVAADVEIDRVSTAGYALGYLGGGVLLAVNVAWILKPQLFGLPDVAMASRVSFLSVAVWWLAFSVPLFTRVREPSRRIEADEHPGGSLVRTSFTRLHETVRELRAYRHAFTLLVAFVLYNDGINTIIRMATSYGTEIGISQNALITAILLVQFVGIPFSFLFGRLAGWMGAKQAIFLALAVYVATTVLGYHMTTALHFYLLAAMVAMVQGGSQALGRSLFASMIPKHKSSELFGFFSVFEKFGALFGPAIFGATIAATGSSRNAILSVTLFFVAGALVLAFVDVEEGQRVARAADANLRLAPALRAP